jgi:putative phage-type endonuclease
MEVLIEEINSQFEALFELLSQLFEVSDKLHTFYAHSVSQYDRGLWLRDYSLTCADQRTPEWFAMRNTSVTASDIGTALKTNKYESTSDLIRKKCGGSKPFSNVYTRWGNKYEDIAAAIYEKENNVKVYEAALFKHPIYDFIGASCDGFVVDDINKDAWLIEIKCPYRRAITGVIPEHYKEQPRTQMACTKIDRCSFFECKFKEYNSQEDLEADSENRYRGILFEYNYNEVYDIDNVTPKQFFIYPPDITAPLDEMKQYLLKEFKKLKQEHGSHIIKGVQFVYWGISEFTEDVQERDPEWLYSQANKIKNKKQTNLERISYIWDTIKHYRDIGIDKLPKGKNI